MLSDYDILKSDDIDITPYRDAQLGPCSYDVTLGSTLARMKFLGAVDPLYPPREQDYDFGSWVYLQPGEFMLGHTEEVVRLGPTIAAQLEGKSSLGRLGLLVHVTAGFIDPGFSGQITLELHNVSANSILLTAGMPIGQLVFHKMDTPPMRTYGTTGRYSGQMGPQISKGVTL